MRESQKEDLAQLRSPTTLPAHPVNRVAAFVRIRWPLSIGLGGRFPSESVAAFPRNPQLPMQVEFDSAGACLKVTKMAFTNAISVAANYLTVGAAITNIPEKKGAPSAMPPGMPGMGGEDY